MTTDLCQVSFCVSLSYSRCFSFPCFSSRLKAFHCRCNSDSTTVVPKLDRLARSVPDAREIADSLQVRGVKLALGASLYDPADPMGKTRWSITISTTRSR
ncbi:TPA: recombinase family protein [Serratia marcescens]|nr:recombinase family protein [Serratia marcescens]